MADEGAGGRPAARSRRTLLLRLDAARADVVRVARTPVARLVVGAFGSAFGPGAARAPAAVRAALPRTEVTVRLLDRAEIVPAVSAGDLDVGLVNGAVVSTDPLPLPEAAGLPAVGAGEEPLSVLLPPGRPLAARTGLRLGDLADALWLDAPAAAVPLADLRSATGGSFPSASITRGPMPACSTNSPPRATAWPSSPAQPPAPVPSP